MDPQSSNTNQQPANMLTRQQFAQNNYVLQSTIGQQQEMSTGPIPVMPTIPVNQPTTNTQPPAWRDMSASGHDVFSMVGMSDLDPVTPSSREQDVTG